MTILTNSLAITLFLSVVISPLVEEKYQRKFISISEIKQNKKSMQEFDFRLDSEEATKSYYAVDPVKTIQLAYLEEHFLFHTVSKLHTSAPSDFHDTLCYLHLSKYLKDYMKDHRAVDNQCGENEKAEWVAENPLLTFRLTRRIVTTLLRDIVTNCDGIVNILGSIKEIFASKNMTLPTTGDLDDAIVGILRIHFIYGFNATSDLHLGILNGVQTNVALSFEDCVALANGAIEMFTADKLAYQWLAAAEQIKSEDNMSGMKPSDSKGASTNETWKRLQKLVRVNSNSGVLLHRLLQGKRQEEMKDFLHYLHYAGCRGETTLSLENQAQLSCFHETQWHPYFLINPVKAEILSYEPIIGHFHDFLSDTTINFIKAVAEPAIRRSGTISYAEPQAEFSSLRFSMDAGIEDTENTDPDPILAKLNKRVEMLTGLKVHGKGASNTQVVRYGSLGYFGFHWDSLSHTTLSIEENGDRAATFLMFLSDTKMGGHTAFPYAGVYAKPKKGSALLFYPLKLNGEPDDRTVHGSCPVLLGNKHVANKWILQYANMFRQSCSLERDA